MEMLRRKVWKGFSFQTAKDPYQKMTTRLSWRKILFQMEISSLQT
jgi:hypothetical protein